MWRARRQGLLLPLPISERFHSELSIDFMTDLPAKKKNDPYYLMATIDRLLNSISLGVLDFMDAENCAERFLSYYKRFHGFLKALTSERGFNWVGDFWTYLCKGACIERKLFSALYPETDRSI